ncbi:hypothetical protein LSAT2_011566, partial [Lamellibrachia satsuma]
MCEVKNLLDSKTEQSSDNDYVPNSDVSEEFEYPVEKQEMRGYGNLKELRTHSKGVVEEQTKHSNDDPEDKQKDYDGEEREMQRK